MFAFLVFPSLVLDSLIQAPLALADFVLDSVFQASLVLTSPFRYFVNLSLINVAINMAPLLVFFGCLLFEL